jgi:hypothetical protein
VSKEAIIRYGLTRLEELKKKHKMPDLSDEIPASCRPDAGQTSYRKVNSISKPA